MRRNPLESVSLSHTHYTQTHTHTHPSSPMSDKPDRPRGEMGRGRDTTTERNDNRIHNNETFRLNIWCVSAEVILLVSFALARLISSFNG